MNTSYPVCFSAFVYAMAMWWCLFLQPEHLIAQTQTPSDTTRAVTSVSASTPASRIEDLSLEELLNVEISVASSSKSRGLTTRESPSIVTLVTEEEIRKSGARDMIDVLRLVPGFEFGVDVQGAVGVGVRGNWAFEGKTLFLLDGQEMNDNSYGVFGLGNRVSVQQIKRVEIIRGPGSALYGGFGELSVINIITKSAEDLKGLEIGGIYGQMAQTYGRRGGMLSIGNVLSALDSLKFSATLFATQGQRSDQTYTDYQGASYSMAGSSGLSTLNANVNLRYKGLNVRFIHDNYSVEHRDKFATIIPAIEVVNHINTIIDAKYDIPLAPGLVLTPRITHRVQYPWFSTTDPEDSTTFRTYRTTANLTAFYEPGGIFNISAGAQYIWEGIEDVTGKPFEYNSQTRFNFTNIALFAQALIKTDIVNVTAGARYERHSLYAPVFVPRIALTKVIDRFHIKGLYSRAFRAPALLNINLNPAIKPETSTVIELEAGYEIASNMLLTANVYNIEIQDAIVYAAVDNIEKYFNFERVETRGFEIEYRLRDKWGYATLSYAFYTAGRNTVDLYRVANQSTVLLGFAPHVINLNTAFDVTEQFTIAPSARFLSGRYGQIDETSKGMPVQKLYDPVFLINVAVRYANILPGLSASLTAYDVLGANVAFIQPYNSLHRPLPGPSREIVLQVSYVLGF
jgi:outer membrane receptor for ferrienterochelin and colicin